MANRSSWLHWKQSVRIPEILEAVGVEHLFGHRGKRLSGPCPLHGGDNPRAFQIDLERNLWFCFTRCARGGDVIELAWYLSDCSWPRTARWLEELTRSQLRRPLVAKQPTGSCSAGKPVFRPFTRSLPLETTHPFFRTLELAPDTLRRFEAGAWRGSGFLDGTVAVRLHDPQGNPLGYAGRRLDPIAMARWGKWKLPPRFPKSHCLFNWHRVRPDAPDGLVVVEGPWSVMKLWQAGFDNAVALCGLTISRQQRALLRRSPQITLLLDGDDAGTRATARHRASEFHPHIRPIYPPAGRDPADLAESHLRTLLKP